MDRAGPGLGSALPSSDVSREHQRTAEKHTGAAATKTGDTSSITHPTLPCLPVLTLSYSWNKDGGSSCETSVTDTKQCTCRGSLHGQRFSASRKLLHQLSQQIIPGSSHLILTQGSNVSDCAPCGFEPTNVPAPPHLLHQDVSLLAMSWVRKHTHAVCVRSTSFLFQEKHQLCVLRN